MTKEEIKQRAVDREEYLKTKGWTRHQDPRYAGVWCDPTTGEGFFLHNAWGVQQARDRTIK